MTITTLISNVRYDLRDTSSTLYTDAELLEYANRGLIQLDNVLSALNSDWVYNEASLSLSTSDNYVAVSTGTIVTRSAWISKTELYKRTPEWIYEERKYISSSGEPLYFAEAGTQLIFERTSDDDYTVKAYYDKRATALALDDDMPYNGEFDSHIREIIALLAHKRQEVGVLTDSQIYNFFMERCVGNVVRRRHVPARKRLDF